MVKLIEILVKKKVLKENNLKMYKAFIEDLRNIGYLYSSNYSTKMHYNHKISWMNIPKCTFIPRKNKNKEN